MKPFAAEAALIARRIAVLIERTHINVTTEAAAQGAIAAAVEAAGIRVEREVSLGRGGRIDLLAGEVGIEVKIRGGNRREIMRQLERYAASDQVAALVIASGGAWPSGVDRAGGKPLFFASLTKGWL